MTGADITNGIEQIIEMIIINIQRAWNILGNIRIWDINLLIWCATIFVLSIVIPIIFTIVKSGSAMGSYAVSSEIRRKQRNKNTKKG